MKTQETFFGVNAAQIKKRKIQVEDEKGNKRWVIHIRTPHATVITMQVDDHSDGFLLTDNMSKKQVVIYDSTLFVPTRQFIRELVARRTDVQTVKISGPSLYGYAEPSQKWLYLGDLESWTAIAVRALRGIRMKRGFGLYVKREEAVKNV